jgi:hypothetical protein
MKKHWHGPARVCGSVPDPEVQARLSGRKTDGRIQVVLQP